jgi:hypothetical protein
MKTITYNVEICVVGGGLSGLCAALSAARHGAQVVLMHDRAVLGGNASSEIRVPISGAWFSHDRSVRETGIVEEIALDVLAKNPTGNWSIWNEILHEKASEQPNLQVLLNCSCADGTCSDNRIVSVKGWQSTTYTWHEVRAKLFIDCSGDSILADISGANTRSGREAQSIYNEPDAPTDYDPNVMGSSLMFTWRDCGKPVPFVAPDWAYRYESDEEAPNHTADRRQGQLWHFAEFGGNLDTLGDTEHIRDELLKIGLGIVDHIKNRGDHGAENYELEWFGFLPGKRENRRYVGDYTLTENDIVPERAFDDIVAYGGWPVDDHDSRGSLCRKATHTFFRFQSPYPIPYRSLYSADIDNLLFAGRNISVSHLGLCTTRVMATCGLMGQAVGAAAAIAAQENCSPREVGRRHLQALQNLLMDDDCWLPGLKRLIAPPTLGATLTASSGDPAALVNGIDRPLEEEDAENAWLAKPGDWAELRFGAATCLRACRLVFDSYLHRKFNVMPHGRPQGGWDLRPPQTLVKAFRLLAESADGQWTEVATVQNNAQRLVKLDLDVETTAIRLQLDETWGADQTNVFAWEVSE